VAANRQQNDLLNQPTQVRLIARFQDVRVLAIGVLGSPRSLWVNTNAFAVLHPPGLEDWPESGRAVGTARHHSSDDDIGVDTAESPTPAFRDRRMTVTSISSPITIATAPSSKNVRRFSDGNALTLSSEPSGGKVRRLFRTISRGTDEESHEVGTSPTTAGRLSSLFLGRRKSREVDGMPSRREEDSTARSDLAVVAQDEVLSQAVTNAKAGLAMSSQSHTHTKPDKHCRPDASALPYKPLHKPQPAYPHRLYPNYTPLDGDPLPGGGDLRSLYPVAKAPGAYSYGPRTGSESNEDDRWVPVELDDVEGQRSWVGPMMYVCLPCFLRSRVPSSTTMAC
jgi:hypothetical protein